MKNLLKKFSLFATLFGVAVLMSGCMSGNRHMQQKQNCQKVDAVVVYEVDNSQKMNHNQVMAKMYTHSSHGGDAEMGNITFTETKDGVKMTVDLIDLRPNVSYNMRIYKCDKCQKGMCCDKPCMQNKNLPMLMIQNKGRLQQSYMLQGMSVKKLNNSKIYLERDGGYKAAWGHLKMANMM